MLEKWVKWKPLKQELAKNYYIDAIMDTTKGFKILLIEAHNEHKKLNIIFSESVYAYRSTYESFRQRVINDLDQKYGSSFYLDWTFFKVNNSSYLKWLSEQSYGITDFLGLTHFAIIAIDSILDIVDSCEPKIELIEEK